MLPAEQSTTAPTSMALRTSRSATQTMQMASGVKILRRLLGARSDKRSRMMSSKTPIVLFLKPVSTQKEISPRRVSAF